MTNHEYPLSRFTVLDLTRVRAGPTAVRQLADWGANIIKIELPVPPEKLDDANRGRYDSDFQNLQRNKRSMTLNLKKETGRAAFMRMVRRADVVVENYRPSVKTRLGRLITRRVKRRTRASSTPACQAMDRTVLTEIARVMIRLLKGMGGSDVDYRL